MAVMVRSGAVHSQWIPLWDAEHWAYEDETDEEGIPCGDYLFTDDSFQWILYVFFHEQDGGGYLYRIEDLDSFLVRIPAYARKDVEDAVHNHRYAQKSRMILEYMHEENKLPEGWQALWTAGPLLNPAGTPTDTFECLLANSVEKLLLYANFRDGEGSTLMGNTENLDSYLGDIPESSRQEAEKAIRSWLISMDTPLPFDRSYWVVPGRLLAGSYPGSKSSSATVAKLQGLVDCGIRHVINLMEAGEKDHSGKGFVPYEESMQRIAAAAEIDMSFSSFPIPDVSVPAHDLMVSILDQIDASMARGCPVYVHCWGGRGRTGTVVGCYLARHGIALGKAALDMIHQLRQKDPTQDDPSPETEKQRHMVRSWSFRK